MPLEISLFTDPACPFAFSAEPVRRRLRWHYGDGLTWNVRMIVLTLEPGEAEKLAEGAPTLQRRFGMPIDPAPYPRPASSEPACRAVVAARRERARDRGGAPAPPAGPHDARRPARRPGAHRGGRRRGRPRPGRGWREWCATEEVTLALGADITAARDARAGRRRARPQARRPARGAALHGAELRDRPAEDGVTAVVPGFNPVEAYEVAIANLAPGLERRAKPASVEELLALGAASRWRRPRSRR